MVGFPPAVPLDKSWWNTYIELAMHPLSENRTQTQIEKVIMRYLSERLDAAAVSTARAVSAVRQQVPHCGLTDDQIIQLVMDKAVDAGFGVSFEGTGPSTKN